MKLWSEATSEPFHILGCETKELEEKIPGDTLKRMGAFQTKVRLGGWIHRYGSIESELSAFNGHLHRYMRTLMCSSQLHGRVAVSGGTDHILLTNNLFLVSTLCTTFVCTYTCLITYTTYCTQNPYFTVFIRHPRVHGAPGRLHSPDKLQLRR